MKLLMCSLEYPPDIQNGGVVSFAELYEQARQNANTRLIVGWQRARSLVPLEAVAVDVSGSPPLHQVYRMMRNIQREIDNWKPDIILLNGFLPYNGKIPSIALLQGTNLNAPSRFHRIRKNVYKQFLNRQAKILCNNKDQVSLLRTFGVASEKIQILRHGIDTNHYEYFPTSSYPKIQIVCPTRILPSKKIENIIDAIAGLQKKMKEKIELHIVGMVVNHVYADKLRIQAYGHSIFFHTDVTDMRPYIQQSHFIIYSHQPSSFVHRTATEAMAMGRCVLWYGDHPNTDIIIPQAYNCSGSVKNLRNKIIWMIENLEIVIEHGKMAREKTLCEFNYSKIWEEYKSIYKDILCK
jgi:glycosyltransferase involved in cell wall biosynthesis